MVIKQGTVVKAVGGVFTVAEEQSHARFTCFSPKKFRYNELDVVVGDKVRFEDIKRGKGVIAEILPRKNKLVRPEIANIDVCFIVLANEPAPDLYLADKVLINCFQERIEPVLVVNKTDISRATLDVVEANYRGLADIVPVCALDGSVSKLAEYVPSGGVACFAGQSAVGKTSLLNALVPGSNGEVGALSEKSGRGMHTTRHSSLHRAFGGFIADTCGFSLCELKNIRSCDLRLYLDDFVRLSGGCRFTSCTHTVEPDCAVRSAANSGQLCRERYERYLFEYKELIGAENKQY